MSDLSYRKLFLPEPITYADFDALTQTDLNLFALHTDERVDQSHGLVSWDRNLVVTFCVSRNTISCTFDEDVGSRKRLLAFIKDSTLYNTIT